MTFPLTLLLLSSAQILAWYLETYAMHAGWRRDLLFEMCKSLGIAVNPPPRQSQRSMHAT